MSGTLEAVRSEALFASNLQLSDRPAADQVRQAVASTLRRFGMRGCAVQVAGEFGDHPDVAVVRMRWALATIRAVYPARSAETSRPRVGPGPLALAG
jgi:hypothetical protein